MTYIVDKENLYTKEDVNMGKNDGNGKVFDFNSHKEIPYVNKNVVEISLGGVIAIIVTIALAAIGATWLIANCFADVNTSIAELKKDNKTLSNDIQSIDQRVNSIETRLDNIEKYLYYDGGVQDQLGDLFEYFNTPVVSIPEDESFEPVITSYKQVSNPQIYTQPSIKRTSQIGYYEDGTPCMANDIVNQPVILIYTEGDNEIYFYGKFNEKFHWNNYCVTNTYSSDGKLIAICESNFEDGKRLDYKSYYFSNNEEWIYSNKNCNDEENIGINKKYRFTYSKDKNFTSTNVKISDILYVDQLIETENPILLTFYSGTTLNNKFDDDSGKAYEVKYDEDGTVKTLYHGRFSDGTFNDDTGEAWDIVYSNDLHSYVHNTGIFDNGGAVKKSIDPLSIEDIYNIISNYKFECDLKWKE